MLPYLSCRAYGEQVSAKPLASDRAVGHAGERLLMGLLRLLRLATLRDQKVHQLLFHDKIP